jgi:hypothetical protein
MLTPFFSISAVGVLTFEPAKAYKQKMRWQSQRIKKYAY